MKAIQMSRFGGPEVFERIEIPIPEPGHRQVLVRVRAAGVNLADTLMRENRYAMTPPLPSVLGSEAAGVIEGHGSGVSGLTIGMRVAAPLFASGNFSGGYADYAVIDADLVTPLPDALPFEDTTALMVQRLTALYLTRQARPKGKMVLVNAAGRRRWFDPGAACQARGSQDSNCRREHSGKARIRPVARCRPRCRIYQIRLDQDVARGDGGSWTRYHL